MIAHWLLSHWLYLAAGGVGLLALIFPAPALIVLRWLFLTERGRYVVLTVAVVASFLLYRDHLLAVSHRACMAEQKAAADRQAAQSRLIEQQHATELANVVAQYERDKADAQAKQDRVVADLRAGTLKLRHDWRCPVPQAAAGSGVSDGSTFGGSEAPGRVIRIGSDADAQLAACQAVIRADRK